MEDVHVEVKKVSFEAGLGERFASPGLGHWFRVAAQVRSRSRNRHQTKEILGFARPPAGILTGSLFVSCYHCGTLAFFLLIDDLSAVTRGLMQNGWSVAFHPETNQESRRKGVGYWFCPACSAAQAKAQIDVQLRSELKGSD